MVPSEISSRKDHNDAVNSLTNQLLLYNKKGKPFNPCVSSCMRSMHWRCLSYAIMQSHGAYA